MVDAVSSVAASYASLGSQASESAQAAQASQQAAQTQAATTAATTAATAAAAPPPSRGPTVVPDFGGGVSGTIVLDYRDPETDQVLVQVPMRSALPQFAAAAGASPKVGKTVDTEA